MLRKVKSMTGHALHQREGAGEKSCSPWLQDNLTGQSCPWQLISEPHLLVLTFVTRCPSKPNIRTHCCQRWHKLCSTVITLLKFLLRLKVSLGLSSHNFKFIDFPRNGQLFLHLEVEMRRPNSSFLKITSILHEHDVPIQSDELHENWGVCGSVTWMGEGSFHHLLRWWENLFKNESKRQPRP